MEKLITTPHDFIWRVKNPQEYWTNGNASTAKCIVYLEGRKLGRFYGVNRTFDDDSYYVNYFDEDGKFNYCGAYTNTGMILEPISK